MEEIFIILGIILLLILFGATFWSNRHEKSRISSLSSRPEGTDENNTLYDSSAENPVSGFNDSFKPSELDNVDIDKETEERVGEIVITLDGTEKTQQTVETSPMVSAVSDDHLNESVQPAVQEVPKPEMIKLFLLAAQGYHFTGIDIAKHLSDLGLIFGEYNIFHRHLNDLDSAPVLYSVADMNPPGSFDAEQMANLATNGLLFFMPLPCNGEDPVENLDFLLRDVKMLAEQMQGYIFDDQGKLFDEDSHYRYVAMVRRAR